MASKIEQFLNKILSSRYGKDVRQAIHDGIKQCYSDVTNPDLNVDAFETAVQNKIDSGALAAMTIADGSITKEKLDQDITENIETNTQDITNLKSKSIYNMDGVELDSETQAETNINILSLYFTNEDRITNESYDPSNGEILTDQTGYARYPTCPIVPGSKLYVGNYVGVVMFGADGETYKGAVSYNRDPSQRPITIDVPADVFFVGLYSPYGDRITVEATHGFYIIRSNSDPSTLKAAISKLTIPWSNVTNKDDMVDAKEKANESYEYIEQNDFTIQTAKKINQIFNPRKVLITADAPSLFYDGFYAGYPFTASTSYEQIILYDEYMNYITVYDEDGTPVSRDDIGVWALANRDIAYFNGLSVEVHQHTTVGSYYTGTYVLRKFTLSKEPKYIKMRGESLRTYNCVCESEIPENSVFSEIDTSGTFGLIEQLNRMIENSYMSYFNSGAFANRFLKYEAIRQINKSQGLIRIATYNIYGAGYGQSNWNALKDQMYEYGLDICAMQEVRDPLGTEEGNKKLSEEMTSEMLPYASTNGELYPKNTRSALSRYPIVSSSEFEFEEWVNDRRCLAKYEIQLPRFKNRIGSDKLKMSVYNTQLDLASMNIKGPEVQEILNAVNEDPNPFIVICMDSNDSTWPKETWEMITDHGFTYAIDNTSKTVVYDNICLDQIFVNSNMQIKNYDVIDSNDYIWSGGQFHDVFISDHDLCFADIELLYNNIWCIDEILTNVTSNLKSAHIKRGESFTAQYTVDEGYTISSVLVWMIDENYPIQNDVWDEETKTINIPEVTGDIRIKIVADATD